MAQGLEDLRAGLAGLGAPAASRQTPSSDRGSMITRSCRVEFAGHPAAAVWTFELPDGRIERYQIWPIVS